MSDVAASLDVANFSLAVDVFHPAAVSDALAMLELIRASLSRTITWIERPIELVIAAPVSDSRQASFTAPL